MHAQTTPKFPPVSIKKVQRLKDPKVPTFAQHPPFPISTPHPFCNYTLKPFTAKMRAKRSKKYRKLMNQYALTFGFREPYQVLGAPTILFPKIAIAS